MRSRRWLVGALALVLLAAACSSSKKSTSTATTAASGGTATTAASGSGLKLDKPIKVVLLAEIVGESAIAVNYYIQELGSKKIGFMGTNESYGNASLAGFKSAMAAANLTPYAIQQYSPTATDLTAAVLAMKGADAVVNYGYPNPVAVQLKQFQQNGLDIPTISGGSSFIVVQQKLATGAAVAKLYASTACNPTGSTDPAMQSFTQTYQQRFNETPGQEAAVTYDSLFVLKAAIEQAGSADPAKVNDALSSVKVSSGVICQPDYHADGAHIMGHTVTISSFASDGSSKIVKTSSIPDQAKASS